MLNRHACWVLALAVLTASSATAGWADDAHKPAAPANDDDLLEFLGSVDTASDSAQPDDGSWIDYLSQADINRITRPNPTVVAVKPPGTVPKPSPPGTQQNE